MGSHDILQIVYEIQGLSDPNHPRIDASGALVIAERMDEIYRLACQIMEQTGYCPSDNMDVAFNEAMDSPANA